MLQTLTSLPCLVTRAAIPNPRQPYMLFAVSFSDFCLMSYCGNKRDVMKMTPCIVIQLVENQSWWDGFDPGAGHNEENPTNVGFLVWLYCRTKCYRSLQFHRDPTNQWRISLENRGLLRKDGFLYHFSAKKRIFFQDKKSIDEFCDVAKVLYRKYENE